MANKWMRKLGIGMSVILTVSQLSTGMVLAAPEEKFDEGVEVVFEDQEDSEGFEDYGSDFGDMLEDKFLNEEQAEIDELYIAEENETDLETDFYEDIDEPELLYAKSNISLEEYRTKYNAFINDSRYSNGAVFNNDTRNYLSSHGSSGCMAYACEFTKYVYGIDYCSSGEKFSNADEIRAGDIISTDSYGGHFFVILERDGNTLYTAEGNWQGKVRIGTDHYSIRNGKIYGDNKALSLDSYYGCLGFHYTTFDSSSIPEPKEYTPFDIARIAEGEVGTVGGSKYSSNSGGWAAYFANWCYRTAGADTTTWPEYANITKFIEYFQGQGRYHDKVSYSWSYKEYSGGGKVDNYIPQWGDFVVIEANGNDADGPDTGGIVTSRSAYEDRITIAVGNQDDKVVSYNYKMSTGYPMDGSTSTHIVGVCNPDFKGNFINGTVEKVEAGAGTIHVKGWTFDYDDLSVSLPVYVYVGGKYDSGASRYDIVADIERPDVNAKYGITGAHGFDATIKVAERGTQEVWIHSNDIGTKAFGGINLGSNTGFSVNVTDQIEKINVSGVSMDIFGADLQVGVDQRIYATVSPSNAEDKTLVWKTSDENVVIVDQKGNFTTIAPGKAIITVTATNGTSDTADDVSATCIITVFEDKPDPTTTPDPTGTEKPTVTPEPTGTEEPTIPPTPTGSENTSAKIAVTNISDNDAVIAIQLNVIQNVSNVFVNVWQGESYWDSDNVCYEFYDVNKATDFISFNISDIGAKLEPGKQYGVTLSIYCDSGYIMPDDATFTTPSTHSSDPTPTPKDPDSTPRLEVGTDGQTHCYVNGVENDFYNGLALYNDGTGDRFVYAAYGKMDTTKMGFTDYEGGKFLIVKGEIETGANGLVQDIDNPSDWYYCANGQVQSQYTGLAFYDGEWFYINRGKLNTILTAYVSYDGGLFYVAAGRIVKEVNGLAKDPNGRDWYYLANGQAQTQYTGLAQYDGAWFYVVKGKLAENYTGQVKYDGAIFNVVNGMLK